MTTAGISKALCATYDEALARVPEALEAEGYEILGARNPLFAHEALQGEIEAGLRPAMVLAIDPTKTVAATGNPKLAGLAQAVEDKLTCALGRLA